MKITASAEKERKEKTGKVPFYHSMFFKNAVIYLSIIAVVLILINTYPLLIAEDLVFQSKQTSLQSQISVVASALTEQETLTVEQTNQVMTVLGEMDLSRVVVTDEFGQVLYDSLAENPPEEGTYSYLLTQPVHQALNGYDYFVSSFEEDAFISEAASPLVYRNVIIGSVYLCDVDTDQAQILTSIAKNIESLTILIAVLAAGVTVVYFQIYARRTGTMIGAIRRVREGDYDGRVKIKGKDEIAAIADEFNQMAEKLQETETVRRRFVSDASHELRTPLASIRLLTDSIMENDMDQETMKEFVGDIGDEAERLQRITEKLLIMTRIDNKAERPLERVRVGDVMQKVGRMLLPLAEKSDVTLRLSESEPCYVQCAEDDLYEILFNLIENGIKYNRKGGMVEASCRRVEGEVIIDIADTGVGIKEEDMDKVFLRFYRVDKARSRETGGTGLGLSIVSDLAANYGGKVEVHRREPEGSIFTVHLPEDREEENKQ